ncbi:hypothetical protein ILUMI_12690, partial [Ignelater luminosus]
MPPVNACLNALVRPSVLQKHHTMDFPRKVWGITFDFPSSDPQFQDAKTEQQELLDRKPSSRTECRNYYHQEPIYTVPRAISNQDASPNDRSGSDRHTCRVAIPVLFAIVIDTTKAYTTEISIQDVQKHIAFTTPALVYDIFQGMTLSKTTELVYRQCLYEKPFAQSYKTVSLKKNQPWQNKNQATAFTPIRTHCSESSSILSSCLNESRTRRPPSRPADDQPRCNSLKGEIDSQSANLRPAGRTAKGKKRLKEAQALGKSACAVKKRLVRADEDLEEEAVAIEIESDDEEDAAWNDPCYAFKNLGPEPEPSSNNSSSKRRKVDSKLEKWTQLSTKIYFDNLFTSIGLLDELTQIKLGGTETLRQNRITKNITVSDSKQFAKTEKGSYECMSNRSLLLMQWHDNAVVSCLTNCDPLDPLANVQRYFKKNHRKINVKVPGPISKRSRCKQDSVAASSVIYRAGSDVITRAKSPAPARAQVAYYIPSASLMNSAIHHF